MADDAPSPVADLERRDDEMVAFFDADQTVMHLRAGQVLSADDVAAIKLVTDTLREDDERVIDAYSRGFDAGRLEAAGAEATALLGKIDELEVALQAQKALTHFYSQTKE